MEVDAPKRKLERDLEIELGDDYTLDLQSKSLTFSLLFIEVFIFSSQYTNVSNKIFQIK